MEACKSPEHGELAQRELRLHLCMVVKGAAVGCRNKLQGFVRSSTGRVRRTVQNVIGSGCARTAGAFWRQKHTQDSSWG